MQTSTQRGGRLGNPGYFLGEGSAMSSSVLLCTCNCDPVKGGGEGRVGTPQISLAFPNMESLQGPGSAGPFLPSAVPFHLHTVEKPHSWHQSLDGEESSSPR
jgi:hypothetical protein